MNGPFKCGKWPDIKIFRSALKHLLLPQEKVEADAGYRGDRKVRHPGHVRNWNELKAKKAARGRHETVNGRLKNWNVIDQVFRHNLNLHGICFLAVAVLTQLMFERGYRPYQVNY